MPNKHIHRLKKHRYKTGVSVFFCTLDCHYKVEAPLALGKETQCNICGDTFTMNEYTIKLVKPHCPNCGRKEVRTPDGKKYYVRKVNQHLLATIAEDDVSDLRKRLDSISTPVDEDI